MAEGIPVKPITTSRFYVEFDGMTDKLIKSVQEISFQGQVKGNDKVLASGKKGKTFRQSTSAGYEENPNFTLEVYLAEGDMDFYEWMRRTMPTGYAAGSADGEGNWAAERKNGSIVAYDPGDEEILRWNITNAWIKSYKVSDFVAESNELCYETYEMVCEDIRRVSPGGGSPIENG